MIIHVSSESAVWIRAAARALLLLHIGGAGGRAPHRIIRFCAAAFLTAASGMPASKVTSRPSC